MAASLHPMYTLDVWLHPRTLPSGQQPRLKEYWHSSPSATEGTDEKHERDKSRETREMERAANGICDQRVRKISYAEI